MHSCIHVGFSIWISSRVRMGMEGVAGNGATFYFLVFAILAGVVGAASKFAGVHHVRAWRHDSLATNAASSLVAWAITALAFGSVCSMT